ncbi:hypothetical protein [Bacillus testis]|uniref:hypothetical protein n=1 Tax=Bacillus testis TaxID=1622072 RepID=UPI00067EA047|nr:hypothetical protein [Bacillus testis]
MKKVTFSISLFFFWIKGKIEVDSRFIKTDLANTILGFIPAGKDQQSIPLKNISGTTLTTKYNLKPIILGLIVLFIGFGNISDHFILGLILFILGVGIAASGIQTILNIEKSGTPYLISVPFFEKKKLHMIQDHIHGALAANTDKTDLNLFL